MIKKKEDAIKEEVVIKKEAKENVVKTEEILKAMLKVEEV